MLDYIFFHRRPYQAFADFLRQREVAFRVIDELMSLINAVVDAVENPDERPLCKIE